MKPIIRWAGGKQALAYQLYTLFPHNIDRYYEPFLGAGSVFFYNGFTNSFLSDLNSELINFYKWIKIEPAKFHYRLKAETSNFEVSEYYSCRELFNKKRGSNSLAQAVRFCILNKYSFNGIYRVNLKGEYNVPFGKANPNMPSLEQIILVSKKLENAELNCCTYSEILNKLEKNDFVYLDPPYPPLNKTSMFSHYTADRFSASNQEELSRFCFELDKIGVRFLMSNANTDSIVELYSNYEQIVIEKTRFVNCKKERIKVKELCIRNYHE